MTTGKNILGGAIEEVEVNTEIVDIPGDRILITENLTGNFSVKPEIVKDLTCIQKVFEHYRPKVEVGFETENGGIRKETLSFDSVADFGIKGITAQSPLLQKLKSESMEYHEIIRQLNSNKLLRQALMQPEYKTAFLNVLEALIMEIVTATADLK